MARASVVVLLLDDWVLRVKVRLRVSATVYYHLAAIRIMICNIMRVGAERTWVRFLFNQRIF